MTISEIIQAVLVGALVIVTIYYAYQNKCMKDEMRKDRELRLRELQVQTKPVITITKLNQNVRTIPIVGDLSVQCNPGINLCIENVGYGQAMHLIIDVYSVFDIQLRSGGLIRGCFHFCNKPSGSIFWQQTIPGKSGTREIEMYFVEKLPEERGISQGLKYKISYTDIHGEATESSIQLASNFVHELDVQFDRLIWLGGETIGLNT